MDTDFDLLTFSGFLPYQLDNEITGFEYGSWFMDDDHKKKLIYLQLISVFYSQLVTDRLN